MQALYNLERSLVQRFWFLPPDIHERQRFISGLIPPGEKILDVGGEQHVLEERTQARDFYTLNVDSQATKIHNHHQKGAKDLVYDGQNIPFPDNEFDTILCIDVLEHVPRKQRTSLIREMLRVASHRLICSAPMGTEGHIQAEKELMEDLRRSGHEVAFLAEHIQQGLPEPSEVGSWQKLFLGQVWFAGDYRLSALLIRLQTQELSNAILNHLWFFTRLGIYAVCNICLYPLLVGYRTLRPTTNRFYILIEK